MKYILEMFGKIVLGILFLIVLVVGIFVIAMIALKIIMWIAPIFGL